MFLFSIVSFHDVLWISGTQVMDN